jgi:hypothetical protein
VEENIKIGGIIMNGNEEFLVLVATTDCIDEDERCYLFEKVVVPSESELTDKLQKNYETDLEEIKKGLEFTEQQSGKKYSNIKCLEVSPMNQEEKRTLFSIKNKLRIMSPWHKNEEELTTAISQKGYSIIQELDLDLNVSKHLR